MVDFSNQTVVIAGAAGNLGQAVARVFLDTGAHLVLVDRSEYHLRQVYPELVDAPEHFLANCSNLLDRAAVDAVIQETARQFGRVDMLVNTAGGYRAAKSAVIRLTESMAAELKRKHINVNCILPGTIDTPQNSQAMPDTDHSRWVKPESLAGVILFLASEAARDIHGAALPVYGTS